jgi:hypothetical protein
MLLLTDGSVLVSGPANANQPQEWLRLLPDKGGHYVDGTWMTIPDSICPHGLFASQMMTNGKLFIAGGENPGPPSPGKLAGCTGRIDTEIFDPSVPVGGMPWTAANPPTNLIDPGQPGDNLPGNTRAWCPSGGVQWFGDMISETLPDGSVLMAPVCPNKCGDTLIYHPNSGWDTNTFPLANTGGVNPTGYSCSQQEDTWVKLQDGSILTADPPSPPAAAGSPQTPQTSERFIPSQMAWVAEANLGFALYDTEFGWSGGGETGPAFTLPNGQAIFIGASPVIGTYNPATNTWSQSNIAPNGPAPGGAPLVDADGPGAMMVTGNILLRLTYPPTPYNDGPYNNGPAPAFSYEYDPTQTQNATQGTFTEVPAPGARAPSMWTDNCPWSMMLDLPDGSVLRDDCNSPQLYVYTPSGTPLSNGQPQVQSVSPPVGTCSTCYLVAGTGFDGISEGASFGDDAQMATDFPIMQLTDGSGNIAYARTYDWSSTSIAPGAQGSTYFQVPAGFGPCDLQVVGNGNPSSKFPFTHDCVIPPHIVAVCAPPQCGSGGAVIWLPPSLGDPWIDGLSVSLLTSDPETTDLLGNYHLSVDTQTVLGSEVARQVVMDAPASGAGSALVVGPTIEMRSRKAGDQQADHTNAHLLAGMISIPYEPHGFARQDDVRIVRFDDQHRRWVSVSGSQRVDASKHVVTAAISELGKFTVVEIRRTRP